MNGKLNREWSAGSQSVLQLKVYDEQLQSVIPKLQHLNNEQVELDDQYQNMDAYLNRTSKSVDKVISQDVHHHGLIHREHIQAYMTST